MAIYGPSFGYGLTDIQQLRREIQALRREIEQLEPKLEKGTRQLETWRQLERVALRYYALARRMGLPDDADQALRVLTRILITMRMLEITGTMLFSGTPFGFAMGVAGLILAQASMLEGY